MSSNTSGITTSFIETIRNVIFTYKGTVGEPTTIADIAKIARIEPITLISSNLTGVNELYNILHGILNIYASYYLQAIHILSAQLSDVRILKILDKTNPDRDFKTLLTSGYTAFEDNSHPYKNIRTLSLENCKFKLPMLNSDEESISTEGIFDESIYDNPELSGLTSTIIRLNDFEKLGSAVGKVILVEFNVRNELDPKSGQNKVAIPVVVRLDNMIIPSEVINNILISNKDEIKLGSRFKDAISGRISFIKDFILCSDLIKTQKRTMIKDPTGYYSQLLKRINNSRLFSALSGNISLAGISGIAVISEQDEQEIQKHIGGKLTNQKTRDIVFDNISAMMIAVIDSEWERVSIYIRNIDGFSQNSFDSFKSMTDKSNNNILDMLKAFNMNVPPSF